MTLQAIRIVHVKGIQNRTFSLNIIPNKPSLLYAPNGFGKSSFATAFNSLNNNRINLSDDNLYKNDDRYRPSLEIEYLRPDGTVANLQANDTTNTIKDEFDCVVINNRVRAKGTPLRFAGRTQYATSLSLDPIVLIDKIPNVGNFEYNVTDTRQRFGKNGKILSNLSQSLESGAFLSVFYERMKIMDKLGQVRNAAILNDLKDRINQQHGTTEQILDWIEANELGNLDAIEPVRILTDEILSLDLGFTRRSERSLAVLEMVDLYLQNKNRFKSACERVLYEVERNSYIQSFRAFNSTWKNIRPKEKDGQLVIEFPKVHHISNGQRDILCLVALLEQARRKLKKSAAILILDEVFDYLDEANLIAAQYYITEFINDFKKSGRRIYPLILTHLNPGYFKNYSFSNLKVYYLDQRTPSVSQSFIRLIQHRDDPTIQADVSMYLLHYHVGQINKRAEFQVLGLKPTWGENNNFVNYVDAALQAYLSDQPGYDPFAVCCAVRRRVEENIYNVIPGAAEKNNFLTEHGTDKKLQYAKSLGVQVPEYYYLLGILYNDGLHWKAGRDNESPLKAKLENGTIRKLVSDVFN